MSLTGTLEVLLSKLGEQKAGFEAMLELARRQVKAAQDDRFPANIEEFQLLVGERQELMQRLETMQAEIAGLERELASEAGIVEFTLKAIKGRVPDQQYEEMARRLAELGDVLYRINRVDEELETTAMGKLKAGRTGPDNAFKRQQALQAYKETLNKKEPPATEQD